jgi:hypothetical protein
MLIIRDAQMDTLGADARVLWLMRNLCELFPGDWLNTKDAGLEAFVRGASARASGHGFKSDDHLAWAALEHVLGEDFPEQPGHAWAAELLADHSVPRSVAIQRLREEAILRLAYPPAPLEAQEASHG